MDSEGHEADFEFACELADGPADGAGRRVNGCSGRDDGLDLVADCLKGFLAGTGANGLNDGEAGAGRLLDAKGKGEAAESSGAKLPAKRMCRAPFSSQSGWLWTQPTVSTGMVTARIRRSALEPRKMPWTPRPPWVAMARRSIA